MVSNKSAVIQSIIFTYSKALYLYLRIFVYVRVSNLEQPVTWIDLQCHVWLTAVSYEILA